MARTIVALMLLAMAACSESFTPMPRGTHFNPSLFVSVLEHDITAEAPMMTENLEQHVGLEEKPKVATKRKPVPKKDAEHKHGPLSPLVVLMKQVMGEDELNRLRGKVIGLHSDVIGKFVETAETPFGEQVLRVFFALADKNKNGAIEEEELAAALRKLGFELKEKQIKGIFERADLDANGYLDYQEWRKEAPKTLRTNLIKLAKRNGGEMGLLA